MTVGQALKNVRKKFALTQKQTAEGAKLPYRSYQDYERDVMVPSVTAIMSLADFFNVSTDYLLGRSDNPARL